MKRQFRRVLRRWIQRKDSSYDVTDVKKMIALKVALPEIVSHLHAEGLTLAESVSAINRATRWEIDGKTIVTSHRVWKGEVEAVDKFHEELQSSLEKQERDGT